MSRPQSGLLPDGNPHALFLTVGVGSLADDAATVRRALATIPGLTDEVGAADADARLLSVVAIGSTAWDLLYPGPRPARLRPFKAFDGPGGIAPSTPADVFLHIRSDRLDLNFELARQVRTALGTSVTVIE